MVYVCNTWVGKTMEGKASNPPPQTQRNPTRPDNHATIPTKLTTHRKPKIHSFSRNVLYAACADKSVAALDVRSGDLLWVLPSKFSFVIWKLDGCVCVVGECVCVC